MEKRDTIFMTADATLPARTLDGDVVHCEALATPEGHPVKLTDGSGREIGTAVVVDGRIHATVTDRMAIERLRHDNRSISMGYHVVIEPEPAIPATKI